MKYSNVQLVSVADELKKDNDNVKQLVKDYQKLRDACRSLKD